MSEKNEQPESGATPATQEQKREGAESGSGDGLAARPRAKRPRRPRSLKLDGEFLTVEEAAVIMGIDPKSVYSRIYRGQVPGAGRDAANKWRIKRAVLVASVKESCAPSSRKGRR